MPVLQQPTPTPRPQNWALITPATTGPELALGDFSEVVEFGVDGRPLVWALLRHDRGGRTYAFASGANAPPWNDDGVPPAMAAARPNDALCLTLLHSARARKLRAWLIDRSRDARLWQACASTGRTH